MDDPRISLLDNPDISIIFQCVAPDPAKEDDTEYMWRAAVDIDSHGPDSDVDLVVRDEMGNKVHLKLSSDDTKFLIASLGHVLYD